VGAGREGEADFGAREPQRSWLWAWHWNPGPTDMTEDPCNVIGKLFGNTSIIQNMDRLNPV
jgi:hypothetical protein